MQDVELCGTYPDTETVVTFKRSGFEYLKSVMLYSPGRLGSRRGVPPVDPVACIVGANVAD